MALILSMFYNVVTLIHLRQEDQGSNLIPMVLQAKREVEIKVIFNSEDLFESLHFDPNVPVHALQYSF